MGALKSFKDLKSKQEKFSGTRYFQIDTKKQFDQWFEFYTSELKQGSKTDFIYRGIGDASYKLYTSAQRMWIQNDMHEWAGVNFLHYIHKMVQKAKKHELFKRALDIFGYSDEEREFPLLSILQHYWAPTPLMDWTYNINVALFFAIEKIETGNGTGKIGNYFSIYRINKKKYRDELLNITDITGYKGKPLLFYENLVDEVESNANMIFYLSDFDEGNISGTTPNSEIILRRQERPITSLYNQNIVPQEGLFIFNPFSTKTIDDIFNIGETIEGANLALAPFACFNIKKDLAEYIRRHIKQAYKIDKGFIYPHLYDDATKIANSIMDSFAK